MAEREPYTITDEKIDVIIETETALHRVHNLIQSVQEARAKVGLKKKVVLFGSSITGQEVNNDHDVDYLFDLGDEMDQDWKDNVALYASFEEELAKALNSRNTYPTEITRNMFQSFIDWGAASTCDLFKHNYYLMIGDQVEVVRRGIRSEPAK